MTCFRSVFSVCLFSLLLLSIDSAIAQSGDFITVRGNQFYLNSEPYYFAGTNLWYGANLGSPGEGGNRARLIRELDRLQSLGITNLRVLGASEGEGSNRIRQSFQPEPGEYNENLFIGLDFLLSEMAKRDMYAVIYLNNYWVWSGGMSQYMSWITGDPVPNPFLPDYTWTQFMNFSATFYPSDEANAYYRQYLTQLVTRTNTVTGKRYINDPTIMAWQLANEPRPGRGAEGRRNADIFNRWIYETAGYIKSLDPNHLVTTGNEGTAGSLHSPKIYLDAHRGDDIDYMTMHLWVKNWGWFDATDIQGTYESAVQKAVIYLQEHIRYADSLKKPLTMEEFGIPRDNEAYQPGTPTTARDRYYRKMFSLIHQNARAGGPMAGSNFWTWGGEGKPQDNDATWRVGDPYTGDPPQEPQGLNSVFSGDTTTLQVIREHARNMNALSGK